MKTLTKQARSRLLPGAIEQLEAAGLLTTKYQDRHGKKWTKDSREKWARQYAKGWPFPLTEELIERAPKRRRGIHAADGKFPAYLAKSVAAELIEQLKPAAERIEIVGSVRRGKKQVGDLELLIIPRYRFTSDGKLVAETDEVLERLLDDRSLALRLKEDGSLSSFGEKNKHLVHRATGLGVDLFFTDEGCWWNSLVCRTGGAENNKALAQAAIKAGRHWNVYGSGVTLADGTVIQAESEEHVFELCGLDYLPPEERT